MNQTVHITDPVKAEQPLSFQPPHQSERRLRNSCRGYPWRMTACSSLYTTSKILHADLDEFSRTKIRLVYRHDLSQMAENWNQSSNTDHGQQSRSKIMSLTFLCRMSHLCCSMQKYLTLCEICMWYVVSRVSLFSKKIILKKEHTMKVFVSESSCLQRFYIFASEQQAVQMRSLKKLFGLSAYQISCLFPKPAILLPICRIMKVSVAVVTVELS